ncbi:hypothetical protein ONZ51_g1365 [Trametes cubensis]|uniref:RING-type E3 ubiquitin transferase n=1 Tax=Trametes cubensis TaxID=1111947 RepID=A0AAD7U2A0_9APHY|nr:hypothetical protein ONZ51_g1365 [Trametes cubensis]
MLEEPDTCRICSAPAEPDQPLFHPCKCSGTIRYIHQDCLTEWLAHSKKKTCDVCKYPYSFTKVYSKDMPERLPFFLILRQFSLQLLSAVVFGLRTILVASIWLAALPWVTIWTWRMYFSMGNHVAWWISALKRPEHEPDLFDDISSNATTVNLTSTDPQSPPPTGFLTHPRVLQVSSDIVAGQIIASMIVIAFVAIFLLREWITQNARPGIFEDGDVPAEAEVQDGVQPLPEVAIPAPEIHDQAPVPVVPPVVEEPPRHNAAHDAAGYDGVHREDMGPRGKAKKPRTKGDVSTSGDAQEPGSSRHARPRNKGHPTGRAEKMKRNGVPARRPSRTVRRTLLDARDDDESEYERFLRAKELEFRRLRYVRGIPPRPDRAQSEPGPSKQSESEDFSAERRRSSFSKSSLPALVEFTFTVPTTSASPPSEEPSSETGAGVGPASPRPNGYGEPPARNPFARRSSPPLGSSTEDERDLTPTYPAPGPSSSSRAMDFMFEPSGSSSSASYLRPSPSSSTGVPLGLRRPPLPTVTLPPSPAIASSSASAAHSRKHTPLASPSLATYRAPEELDAGGSSVHDDYFEEREKDRETEKEREREHEREQWDEDFTDEELEEAERRYFRNLQERRRVVDEERQAEAQREREEREAMADVEQDGEVDDEADDVRWTDEEIVVEEEDEEDDAAGRGGEAARLGAEVDVVPDAGAGAPGAMPPPPPPDELENDINIEDDMDGALEAIGLRGPIYGVLQNAILMTLILDITIALGIWLPFTIGKSTALLSLNPRRAMQILHLPLRLIRLVTDPVVDTVLLVLSRLVVPPLVTLGQLVLASCFNAVSSFAGPERAEKVAGVAAAVYDQGMELATKILGGSSAPVASQAASSDNASSYLYKLLEEDTTVMRIAEPYFAPIGHNVRQWSASGKETWIELAMGDDRQDRIFAVLLGYAVVGLLLAIYLNILTVGTMRSAGRAVRSAIRQQLLVVKVAAFIIIELIIFPLGCGMMLDICSVWMFPHGTFRSRAAFLLFAPLRATFYHWVLGTMFMYQFAVLLSGCRGIMRPGAMWFIKDPQDQNFHPIRDILERPTLVQLRKLLLSAAMYGVVVASGVATLSGILRLFRGTIMPFRWKIREPLSEVPIDLIFIQLVLPYTMDYFRPRKALRRFGTFIWKYLARQLRLSSYMFGGRFASEEYTPKHWSWRSLLNDDGMQMDDAEAVHDGTFRRVPNSDNVALVKDSPATVEVDEEGMPVDANGIKLILAQNAEADKARRSVKDDYTVVYIPPHFKYRVIIFLLGIWTVGSMMLATLLAGPILLGRGVFRLFLPYEVHDGYSFIVGFYLLWACWLVGAALDRIIIPTLLGLTVELYIMQPFKHTLRPLVEPRIRMVDMWALGLLYGKIIIRSLRTHHPGHERLRGIDRVIRSGWTHMDPMRTTIEVIAPITAGLLGMILLPAVSLWVVMQFVKLPLEGDFLFVHVYPGLFTLAGLGQAAWALSKVTKSWSQTIRDKEFLVEMRLRNLEEQEQDAGRDGKDGVRQGTVEGDEDP